MELSLIKQLIHENGFTLACLKYFLSAAPCWRIYGCRDKESCPAYQKPHTPCYQIMHEAVLADFKGCAGCAVFLNRDVEKITILERD